MRKLAAFAILLLVAACQAPPTGMTEAEIAQIEAEVTQRVGDWMVDWSQNDCQVIDEYAHPELTAMLYSGEVLDRAEWKEACGPVVENRESWTTDWHEVTVRVLSPDAAVFLVNYGYTIKFTSGVHRTWPRASQGGLVERTTDGWAITLLGSSSGSYEDVEG